MTTSLKPRLLTDKDAAAYIGFSQSFLRNQRYDDVKRIEAGLPPLAPAHFQVGRRIRYTVEALNSWVDAVSVGTHPICKEGTRPGQAA